MARATKQKNGLSSFEGREVHSTTIEIPNASGGLNKGMAIDAQEFHHRQKVYVVLECEVAKVRFDPIKDTDGLRRVHVFSAGDATIVDGDLVSDALEAQRVKIEKAQGIERLPYDGDGDEGAEEA